MELKEKCYFVKGHKNAAIYDLKEEKVYSINEEGKEILCKVLGKNVADFSKIENEFINELKKLNLIEEARIHKKNNIEKSNPNLKYVWLEITEACNLNCVHCYGEFGKPKINHSELISTSEWKLIIDKLREEKCGEIQLIGGEPTVNADFIEILNYAHQKGMKRIDVFTNGTQINEKNISELKKDNVSVRVSLYGHNDEIHDKITQVKGSFEKTTKALALLKKYNIPTRIAVVIMRENEDYINDIKNYIKSIGYDYTGYDTIRPSCANEISKHSVSNPNILESRYNTEPIFYTSQKSFMDNHFYNSCWNGKLVKYDEKYFEYIYATYQDYNSRFLFTNDLVIESKKEMWNKLDKKIHIYYNEFMIIINVSNDLPVGFIYGYDYNTLNGYIYLAIYIDEKSRNNVIGAEAGMLFLNYLVEKYPIRKVYCTVYEYNKPSFKIFILCHTFHLNNK